MSNNVSVVIPAFGRVNLLLRAIESALSQSNPVEVVVVDDDSNPPLDQSLPLTILSKVKLVRNEQRMNAAASRNRGVSEATGDIIAFLDSDDTWYPDHLEKAFSNSDFSKPIVHITPIKPTRLENNIIQDPCAFVFEHIGDFRTSGIVVGREIFEDIGGFDAKLEKHQDWDFVFRAAKQNVLRLGDAVTVNIDVTAPGRMSARPNLEASQRFFQKHQKIMSERHRNVFFSGIIRSCAFSGRWAVLAEAKKWSGKHLKPSELDLLTRLCWHVPILGSILLRGRQALRVIR